MGLIEQAKADIEQITSDPDEWAVRLRFTSRLTGISADVYGLHTKHHYGFNLDTQKPFNAKNAHCSTSEGPLTLLGYPVRNSDREVQMKGDKVDATDIAGNTWTYVIDECVPDETVGLLLFILGDWEPNGTD